MSCGVEQWYHGYVFTTPSTSGVGAVHAGVVASPAAPLDSGAWIAAFADVAAVSSAAKAASAIALFMCEIPSASLTRLPRQVAGRYQRFGRVHSQWGEHPRPTV